MEKEVDQRWNRFKASLAQHLKTVPCKQSAPLDKYYDAAMKVLKTAEKYEEKNNQRSVYLYNFFFSFLQEKKVIIIITTTQYTQTYMFYYRFVSLCCHTIVSHPNYHDPLFREEKQWAKEESKKAIMELENIKAAMRESWKADFIDRKRRVDERAEEEKRRKRELEERKKEEEEEKKTGLKTSSTLPIPVPPLQKSDSAYLDAMRSLNIGSDLYPVKPSTTTTMPTKTPATAAASSSKRNSGIYPVLEESEIETKPVDDQTTSLYPTLEGPENKGTNSRPPSYDNIARGKDLLPPPSYDVVAKSTKKKNEDRILSVRISEGVFPGQPLQVRDPQSGNVFKVTTPSTSRPGQVVQVRVPKSQPQRQQDDSTKPSPRTSTSTTTIPSQPRRPTGVFHSPKEILDAPRGFSLLPAYKCHPIRSTSTGFKFENLISSARPMQVTPISRYQFLPDKSLITQIRKELSKKRHGKDGFFYYVLGHPYGKRFVDIKLAREMSMVFQAKTLRDQVWKGERVCVGGFVYFI